MFNNLFGSKKTTTSTVSATSTIQPTDPQNTIVKLRESIANQEKRWVIFVFQISYFLIPGRVPPAPNSLDDQIPASHLATSRR